jgi:hypothetical protein
VMGPREREERGVTAGELIQRGSHGSRVTLTADKRRVRRA